MIHDRRTHMLIGLILCSQVRPDVGHITQICVLPEYRSAGLGEAMLAASTQEPAGARIPVHFADRDGSERQGDCAIQAHRIRIGESV